MYFLSENPKYVLLEKVLAWLGYLLFLITTGVIGTLIIMHYSGYSFNRSGQVVRTGFVTITSNPVKAKVFLDGQQLKGQTYMRLDVPAGAHNFVVRADGYQEWSRNLTIEPSGIYWLDYVMLYPKNLTPYALQSLPKYTGMASLEGQNTLLGYSYGPQELGLSLVDLNNRSDDNTKQNQFKLSDLGLGSSETITDFKLIKQDRSHKNLLFKLQTSVGSYWLLYNIENPQKLTNISTVFSLNPADFNFSYDNSNQLYYVDTELNLRMIDVGSGLITKALITTVNVPDFTVKNQDTVYYTDSQDRVFLKKYDQDPKQLSQLPASQNRRKLKFVSYNSADFLIEYVNNDQLKAALDIWLISGDGLANRFSTNLEGNIDNLDISKDGRTFLASTDKKDIATFVLDDTVSGRFKLNQDATSIKWATPFQLSYQSADGLHLRDFTGDNDSLIIKSTSPLWASALDGSQRRLYFVSDDTSDPAKFKLNAVDMVTN